MRLLVLACSLFLWQCSWSDLVGRKPAATGVIDKSGYRYDPQDRSCDGFPRLQVETMPGTCLGLVLARDRAVDTEAKKSFTMPRTLAELPTPGEFLVVDMGGWKDHAGSIFWMKPGVDGSYGLKLLKTGLDKPHGLAINSVDGYVYVGESQKISRFHLANGKISDWQLVIGNLPRPKGDMHPLTQFTFDPRNNDLFLNTGAPTDHCYVKQNGEYSTCPEDSEDGMGAIYRIPGEKLKKIPVAGITVIELTAAGLRNSMAMAVHASGTLVQGENSRDFPELEEPYEEINVVDPRSPGNHYGWPYCYNFHGVSPEWRFPENSADPLRKRFNKPVDCALLEARDAGEYQAPHALMPPHVAPLHAAYYQGKMFGAELGGKLLFSWHGYQPSGHRLVAYAVDERGKPITTQASKGEARYGFNVKGACPVTKPFSPAGGGDRVAPYTEVIAGWDARPGIRPRGAPVGFAVAADGSIWISEDKNRTIVRLARSDRALPAADCDPANSNQLDPRIELLAWRHQLAQNATALDGYRKVRSQLTQKYCVGCHGNFNETEIATDDFSQLDFFVKNGWVQAGNPSGSKLYSAIAQLGEYPAMPPSGTAQFFGTADGDRVLQLTANWIKSLPKEVAATVKKQKLAELRRFRDQPSSRVGKVCGQFDAGTTVYVDSREQIGQDGFIWAKVYVLPGDSHLFKQTCAYPRDGVFYVALRAK